MDREEFKEYEKKDHRSGLFMYLLPKFKNECLLKELFDYWLKSTLKSDLESVDLQDLEYKHDIHSS